MYKCVGKGHAILKFLSTKGCGEVWKDDTSDGKCPICRGYLVPESFNQVVKVEDKTVSNEGELSDRDITAMEELLLKTWARSKVEYIYKYKSRVKEYREGLSGFDLFYDLTYGRIFADVVDTADGDDLYAVECKVSVTELLNKRRLSNERV